MTDIDIVNIIENNPINRLINTNNNRFIEKIINKFTTNDQKLFISSFYCYLNYSNNDFVVDMDNIWKWLGFSSKQNAVRILEKYFKLDEHYIFSFLINSNKKETVNKGGHNIKKYLLNIRCFKLLCLKAQTNKADEIHDYYISLEDIINQSLEENAIELKLILQQKDNYINEISNKLNEDKLNIIKEKNKEIEKTIIEQFPVNTECIYLGIIDDTNENNEKLIKFGHSNDLKTRVQYHNNSYKNFTLIYAVKVINRTEIENYIKNHFVIKKHIRKILINEKYKTEIIAYDSNFTIDRLIYYIKEIIKTKTYSIENFNKVIEENKKLEMELVLLKEKTNTIENEKNTIINNLTLQIQELNNKLNSQQSLLTLYEKEHKSVYENALLDNDENTKKFNKFIDETCILRLDVDESCVNLEGQFRIWNKLKPTKEMFHLFKNYLDIRFKPTRIQTQNQNSVVYGYQGIKLKPIEYKKKYASPTNIETFLFQVCKFTPNGKILNSTLKNEYIKWKQIMNINISDDEINEIKTYLNSCDYVIKSTVWTKEGSNEGYYGIMLKSDDYFIKKTSSTGKTIEKVEINTNNVLCQWETIAKAAVSENISAAKLSRLVKNNIIVNNDYLYREKPK